MADRTYDDLDRAESIAYAGFEDGVHSIESPAMLCNLDPADFARFCEDFGIRQIEGLRDPDGDLADVDTEDEAQARVWTKTLLDALEELDPRILSAVTAMLATSYNCGVLTGVVLERKFPA